MTTSKELTKSIAGEVRAEMARQQKPTSELASILSIKHETARLKLTGARAFSVDDLGVMSAWLNVEPYALLKTGKK
jgi:hypothetical protein